MGIAKGENKNIYKIAAWVLTVLLTVAIGGMCFYIFTGPYDPGTLEVSGSCANLSQNGRVNDINGGATYFAEGDAMYCIDLNGKKTIVLDAKDISHINPEKNYIYYISENQIYSIYNKVSITKLTDKKATAMSVNGGWIYFVDENGVMNKMSTDGKTSRVLSAVTVTGSFAVDNGMIYFANGNTLYSIRANGLESTKKVLADDAQGMFSYYKNAIFYLNTKGEVWSFSTDTGESRIKRCDSTLFNFSYNQLAYVDAEGTVHLKINTEDTEFTCEDYKDVTLEALYVTSNGNVWVKPEGKEVEQITLVELKK